jgi:LemA protein
MNEALGESLGLVALVLGVVLIIPLIWLIATYNRFVSLRQHMRESWADIDVELKRRHDLIPNLVETVRGYAAHERTTLERVVELRNVAAAPHADAAHMARDESSLMSAVRGLFVLAEGYPTLKADARFAQLQRDLADTEDRIAAARRFFNANVRDNNRLCEQFPTLLVAALFKFQRSSYFELSSEAERVVPRV